MAANYEILKQSEQDLFDQFERFVKHVMKMWISFNEKLAAGKLTKRDITRIYGLEEQSNQMENEIMDECIWTLSKNQPVASHLRFIISLINSSSDLERISDHIVSAVKWFEYHPTLDKDIRTLLIKISKESQKTVENMLSFVARKNSTETYEEAIQIQKDYRKKYTETMSGISKIIKKKTAEEIANLLTGALINFKHMERNVDHAANILENFIYIRRSDFFSSKRNKQISKRSKK